MEYQEENLEKEPKKTKKNVLPKLLLGLGGALIVGIAGYNIYSTLTMPLHGQLYGVSVEDYTEFNGKFEQYSGKRKNRNAVTQLLEQVAYNNLDQNSTIVYVTIKRFVYDPSRR